MSAEAGTSGSAPGSGARLIRFVSKNLHSIGLPIAVVLLIIIFALSTDLFLTARNLRNVGLQASALATVAFGQMVVILTAGLDLSVGATVALVSVVTALVMVEYGMPAGILAGLLTGVAVGLASGSAVPVDRRPLAELAFADRFGRALELAALR